MGCCQKALSLLRALAHTSWGAVVLHRTLVLPKLEYGCEIYSSATEARLRIIDAMQHAGVRLATFAFRSSLIPSLLVDAGFLPLNLRRYSSLLRCWLRIQRLPQAVSCKLVIQDSRLPSFTHRFSFPKRFGFRVESAMSPLSVPSISICS